MPTAIAKDVNVPEAQAEDRELARQAAADPGGEAFHQLYQRHAAATYRFLLGLTGGRALAEDALQDAWFNVYQHLERYDPSRAFKPWLHQVVRNAGLNALRAQKKGGFAQPDAERRAVSDRVAQAAAALEAGELAERALAALPSETQALLIERYALELKQAELAESYDCTERTIRNRLRSALDELTRALVEARAGGAE